MQTAWLERAWLRDTMQAEEVQPSNHTLGDRSIGFSSPTDTGRQREAAITNWQGSRFCTPCIVLAGAQCSQQNARAQKGSCGRLGRVGPSSVTRRSIQAQPEAFQLQILAQVTHYTYVC